MELRFQQSICPYLGQAVSQIRTQELTQELRLSERMPDVGRVLAAWGQPVLRSKEWRADTVTATGGVLLWCLYAPEDGTAPRCVDAWIPFQVKWNLDAGDREGQLRILPLLRFADGRTVSARKLMLRAGIGLMAEGYYPAELQTFQPEALDDDIQLLHRTYPVRLPREIGEKIFLMDEDIPLSETDPVPEKLISFTMHPEITEEKVLSNKLVFRGIGNLHLVCRDKDGRLFSRDLQLPFSQFAQLEQEHGTDAVGSVIPAVTSLEVDLLESSQLRLKCGLTGQYLITDRCMLETVEDAYSPRRVVETAVESLTVPGILEETEALLEFRGELPDPAGKIADVVFFSDFPHYQEHSTGVELEIPGMFQVLSYGEDGTLRAETARVENRRSLQTGEGVTLRSMVMPSGLPKADGSGDRIQLSAGVNLRTAAVGNGAIPMVTGLEVGEQKEQDPARASLIICRPDGEELWTIAKRCGSTVSAIQDANGLEGEPQGNRLLLIPIA